MFHTGTMTACNYAEDRTGRHILVSYRYYKVACENSGRENTLYVHYELKLIELETWFLGDMIVV